MLFIMNELNKAIKTAQFCLIVFFLLSRRNHLNLHRVAINSSSLCKYANGELIKCHWLHNIDEIIFRATQYENVCWKCRIHRFFIGFDDSFMPLKNNQIVCYAVLMQIFGGGQIVLITWNKNLNSTLVHNVCSDIWLIWSLLVSIYWYHFQGFWIGNFGTRETTIKTISVCWEFK